MGDRFEVSAGGLADAVERDLSDGRTHALHVADLAADPDFAVPETVAAGIRTGLGVPLLRDGEPTDVIGLNRTRVEPFTERQIELVRTFADQAVIAIENARLLGEIRQRQAELRVTFDNMGDGVVMFDAEQRLAAWNRNFQQLLDLPDELLAARPSLGDYIRHLATHGEYGEVDVEAEVRRLIEAAGRQYSCRVRGRLQAQGLRYDRSNEIAASRSLSSGRAKRGPGGSRKRQDRVGQCDTPPSPSSG